MNLVDEMSYESFFDLSVKEMVEKIDNSAACVVKFFQTAGDFINFAKDYHDAAIALVKKQGEEIQALFCFDEQKADLKQIGSDIYDALFLVQPNKKMRLEKRNPDEESQSTPAKLVTKLTKADGCVSNPDEKPQVAPVNSDNNEEIFHPYMASAIVTNSSEEGGRFSITEPISDSAEKCNGKASHFIEPKFTVEQVIRLARADSEAAYRLINKKSDVIAPLFTQAEQVIELARACGGAAHSLTDMASGVIAPLFTQAEQVIELARACGSAAYSLINKKSDVIAPLFTAEQLNELETVDTGLADRLRQMRSSRFCFR